MIFQGEWNSKNQAYLKKVDRQNQDKVMAYTLIRSMCSPQLNALLVVDLTFIGCGDDDPLNLLKIIKRLITARPDGNEELDRQKALGEWLTFRMKTNEKIIDYGRRAVRAFDRLSITGIAVADQPLPKQQAMRFIDGLDSSVPAFHGYKLEVANALERFFGISATFTRCFIRYSVTTLTDKLSSSYFFDFCFRKNLSTSFSRLSPTMSTMLLRNC